jgi:hypothetical protein
LVADVFALFSEGQAQQLPLRLTTPDQPWKYAALFPVKKINLRGPFWVQIEAKVTKGKVGIGILDADGSDKKTELRLTPPRKARRSPFSSKIRSNLRGWSFKAGQATTPPKSKSEASRCSSHVFERDTL